MRLRLLATVRMVDHGLYGGKHTLRFLLFKMLLRKKLHSSCPPNLDSLNVTSLEATLHQRLQRLFVQRRLQFVK